MEKDSFILYKSQIKILKSLESNERLQFYDAIFDYAIDKIDPSLPNAALQALFQIFKHRIDLDETKYQSRCQKNAENINKRWNKENTIEYDRIRTDTKAYESIPSDSDSDSDSDSESDNVNENIIKEKINKKKNSNLKPSDLVEVTAYGQEIGLTPEQAEAFYDHFESNGWKVGGKTPMKDWKAALRNWKRNARPVQTSTLPTHSTQHPAERERPTKRQMLFYALNHAEPLYKVNLDIFAANMEANGWNGDWKQKLHAWYLRVMENQNNPARRFLTKTESDAGIGFREFAGPGTGQVQIHELYGIRLPIRKTDLAEFA